MGDTSGADAIERQIWAYPTGGRNLLGTSSKEKRGSCETEKKRPVKAGTGGKKPSS